MIFQIREPKYFFLQACGHVNFEEEIFLLLAEGFVVLDKSFTVEFLGACGVGVQTQALVLGVWLQQEVIVVHVELWLGLVHYLREWLL